MIRQIDNTPFSQRQLRVGELIKQSLGQIFLRDEAKVPTLETKNITVTEVRMSPDLKNARAYVIPLGGKDTEKAVNALTEFSHLIRKIGGSTLLTADENFLSEFKRTYGLPSGRRRIGYT